MELICPRCKEKLPISEFSKDKSRKSGFSVYCRICDFCRKHKINRIDWFELLEKQNNICAFPNCKSLPTEVDHDHNCCPSSKGSCGKCIRSLLCSKHNMALGQFADNIYKLRDAIKYLDKFEKKIYLYEILVPQALPDGKNIEDSYHKEWDQFVHNISGGSTILTPVKGKWVNYDLIDERMIPVRIACTRADIHKIIQFTLTHYRQEAVMCYRLSDEVLIVNKNDSKTASTGSSPNNS